MHTLVCVIGQTREEDLTWDRFNKFILQDNTDLCLCIDKNDVRGVMKQNAKYIFEYDETYQDFTDGFDMMKDYENGTDEWKKLTQIPNNWIQPLGDISKGTGGLLLFYRWFLWKNLKENNLLDKYDRFVLTRSDYIHTHKLPEDNESILIPAFEFHGGVTDRFAIIPQKYIEEFLRIGTYIVTKPGIIADIFNNSKWPMSERMGKQWGWNLETYIFILLHVTELWQHVKFFAPTMFTAMVCKSERFKNIFNEKYNCYLRYQTEYAHLSDTPGQIFNSKNINFYFLEDDMFIGKLLPEDASP